MSMENGRPQDPSDTKLEKFLRFVDPDDPTKLIQLKLVDTATTTPDGKRIMTIGVDATVTVPPPAPPSAIVSGTFILPDTAANPIGSAALEAGVSVKADEDNAADIYVGDSAVTGSAGMRLAPGESVYIAIDALGTIYAIGSQNDKLHFIGG